mmetsp:Transcript_56693/g.156935  ORF Transcript_56693/g.156935 Transcript_56693/m.156935 type:complete len:206 (+) Transcript_56693:110-727(+)
MCRVWQLREEPHFEVAGPVDRGRRIPRDVGCLAACRKVDQVALHCDGEEPHNQWFFLLDAYLFHGHCRDGLPPLQVFPQSQRHIIIERRPEHHLLRHTVDTHARRGYLCGAPLVLWLRWPLHTNRDLGPTLVSRPGPSNAVEVSFPQVPCRRALVVHRLHSQGHPFELGFRFHNNCRWANLLGDGHPRGLRCVGCDLQALAAHAH